MFCLAPILSDTGLKGKVFDRLRELVKTPRREIPYPGGGVALRADRDIAMLMRSEVRCRFANALPRTETALLRWRLAGVVLKEEAGV